MEKDINCEEVKLPSRGIPYEGTIPETIQIRQFKTKDQKGVIWSRRILWTKSIDRELYKIQLTLERVIL